MCCRIYNTTIAFATNNRTSLLHFRYHVYLAHSCRSVGAAIFFSDIAQGPCGRKVRNRISRSMLQYIIGYSNECVFLAEHRTVFTYHGQAVNIRIDNKGYVMVSLTHEVTDIRKMLFQRLRIMREIACRLHIQPCHLCHAELSEQFGKNNAAHGVYRINSYAEVSLSNSLYINEFEEFHHFYVSLVKVEILCVASQMVNIRKGKVATVGQAHYFRSLCGGEELALLVEKLQSIPLARVMAGRNIDTGDTAQLSHCK